MRVFLALRVWWTHPALDWVAGSLTAVLKVGTLALLVM